MYTNLKSHGGRFFDVVTREMSGATDVSIASGYTSIDVLQRFQNDFVRIADRGGSSRLLLGMAFYEGLSLGSYDLLCNLSTKLEAENDCSGVYVSYNGKYHGKIYRFASENQHRIYVGSSNFSRSGLRENIESTVAITDSVALEQADNFLDLLFSNDYARLITQAEIPVPGTRSYTERTSLKTLDDLKRHKVSITDKLKFDSFEIPLERIVEKEKSSLNVYFGKGRLNRKTGEITPRAWYEVELITSKDVNRNPLYPKGDFTAYTDDGYVIPMVTNGANYKNMRSKGNLRILGQWIKGKLQKSGALMLLTPVTQDTLDLYGRDTIRFYKISNNEYYMEF